MTKATRNCEGGKTILTIDMGTVQVEHHRGGVCIEKRTYTARDLVEGKIDTLLFNSTLGSVNITTVKGSCKNIDPFDLNDLNQMGDYAAEWADGEKLKTR